MMPVVRTGNQAGQTSCCQEDPVAGRTEDSGGHSQKQPGFTLRRVLEVPGDPRLHMPRPGPSRQRGGLVQGSWSCTVGGAQRHPVCLPQACPEVASWSVHSCFWSGKSAITFRTRVRTECARGTQRGALVYPGRAVSSAGRQLAQCVARRPDWSYHECAAENTANTPIPRTRLQFQTKTQGVNKRRRSKPPG